MASIDPQLPLARDSDKFAMHCRQLLHFYGGHDKDFAPHEFLKTYPLLSSSNQQSSDWQTSTGSGFVNKQLVEVLMGEISNFLECEGRDGYVEGLAVALSVLSVLARNEDNCHHITNSDKFSLLFGILESPYPRIVSAVCRVYRNLACDKEVRKILSSHDIIIHLIRNLALYPEHSDVQSEACWVTGNMLFDKENRQFFLQQCDGIDAVMESLQRFRDRGIDDPANLEVCGAMIWALAISTQENLDAASHLGSLGIMPIAFALLEKTQHVWTSLLSDTLQLLGNLSEVDSNNDEIHDHNGVARIFDLMKYFRKPRPPVQPVDSVLYIQLFYTLGGFIYSDDNMDVFVELDVLEFVTQILEDPEMRQDGAILMSCCDLITNALRQSDEDFEKSVFCKDILEIVCGLRRDGLVVKSCADALLGELQEGAWMCKHTKRYQELLLSEFLQLEELSDLLKYTDLIRELSTFFPLKDFTM